MFKDKQYYMTKVKNAITIIGFWTVVVTIASVLFVLVECTP